MDGLLEAFWIDQSPEQVEENTQGNNSYDQVLRAHRPDTILSARYV
jgi:hypothetical protein